MQEFKVLLLCLVVVAVLGCRSLNGAVPTERGTWTIAAVDRETGQIGVAGASCTFNVKGVIQIVPGLGVVIVQGMSSDAAREYGIEQLRAGKSPAEIVAGMREERFDPENQQYAIVSLDSNHPPAAFTGELTGSWRGSATGAGVTVQGNSLVSEDVVNRTLATFQAARGSLAERLVLALAAGAEAGGDKRCGEQRARSAFVTVYNSDDTVPTAYFDLVVYGTEKGGEPAVAHLVEEFNHIFPRSKDRRSSKTYIIPARSAEADPRD